MSKWSFLTNHARVLICIAHDPGVRLREIAAALSITERSAFGIVTELTDAGYVVKEKDGRRNRYQIQGHLPMRDSVARERTIGELLDILVEASAPADANAPARYRRTTVASARIVTGQLSSSLASRMTSG
jgi:DNA-binding transcriptional ArsR family regulator